MARLAGALALILALGPSVAAQDRILRKTGKPFPETDSQRLKVTKETCQAVHYQLGDVKGQSMPMDEVLAVEYGNPPSDYTEAEEAMKAGDHARAIRLFQAIPAGLFQQYALFRIGQAWRSQGNVAEAVQAFRTLIAQIPDSKFLGPAYLEIGTSLSQDPAQRDPRARAAAGREAFAALKKAAADRELGAEWTLRADLMLARMDQLEGRADEATAAYRTIAEQAAAAAHGVADEARLWIGEALLQKKDFDRAREYFESLLRGASPKEAVGLYAGARAGLGQCELEQEKYQDARRNFLWAITLWDQWSGKIAPDVAGRAFYGAGLCFHLLEKTAAREEDARVNRQRARSMFEELQLDAFAATEWPARARAKLEQIQ
jgi:TolA-binding protein